MASRAGRTQPGSSARPRTRPWIARGPRGGRAGVGGAAVRGVGRGTGVEVPGSVAVIRRSPSRGRRGRRRRGGAEGGGGGIPPREKRKRGRGRGGAGAAGREPRRGRGA